MRKLLVWWTILTGMGPAVRLGPQADRFFRYYVLTVLAEEGLFDYLKEPRTYGQILAHFGYVDDSYTRELFDILASDPLSTIVDEDNLYRLNPEQPLPELDSSLSQADKRIHDFTLMADGLVRTIPARLRDKPVTLSHTFEQDGRQIFMKFDQVLGARVYSILRNAAFAFLKPEDRRYLRGKTLLDVGCGSGYEPAELWSKLKGDVRITAIDPVPAMLEKAEQSFDALVARVNPSHPPITENNKPHFRKASATHLPFEDHSFDAVFHSLILPWTPNPRQAISEIARVLKPGGIVFGCQGCRPQQKTPYWNVVIRTNRNCHGFFWLEEFKRWHTEAGLNLEQGPAGTFRVFKSKRS
ncbi:MAG: class I SAM-dependent methyltransferase [Anaerolineae bacterium]|nr:class I SAM-dependent methyltransferase [Anaerolineae bacterium]